MSLIVLKEFFCHHKNGKKKHNTFQKHQKKEAVCFWNVVWCYEYFFY